MAAQAGKDIVVSIKDDEASPAYQVVGGLRTRELVFNSETVDVTNANSTGLWRELLTTGGVRSASVSGAGTFIDDTAATEIKDAFFEDEARDVSFLVPGFGTFEGSFKVTQLNLGGEYNQAVMQSVTFESAGAITFAAA